MAPRSIPLKIGDVFGRLTILKPAPSQRGAIRWVCLCVCGTKTIVVQYSLRNGDTTSCGCYHREITSNRNKTHGQAGTPLYQTWKSIIARCTNPRNPSYPDYGGRGITISPTWRHSFIAFAEYVTTHLGPQPTPKHTLDRIDNGSGHYEPGNLRWATRIEQNRNKRSNAWLTHNNETKLLIEWAIHLGIKRTTLIQRLRYGWSVERTLTEPVHNKRS